jgi:hypothetical protein
VSDAITQALKDCHEFYYLIEVNQIGRYFRWSTKNINIDSSHRFDGKLTKTPDVQTTFDLRGWKYSIGTVSCELINNTRIQDEEAINSLEGAIGTVRIWAPGLTWANIETDGILFIGRFEKKQHNKYKYSFDLVDICENGLHLIPSDTINATTWPNHRTNSDGSGSVSGKAGAIIFGSWGYGIPLLCVDTVNFKYLVMMGQSQSVEADFWAGSLFIRVKSGIVLPAVYFTLVSSVDGKGSPCMIFQMTSDETAAEPMTCGIKGTCDNAGALIEHPADIIAYLYDQFSTLGAAYIDIGSCKSARTIMPSLKCASIINAQASGIDIIDRIASQIMAARIQQQGKLGLVTFDLNAPAKWAITQNECIGERVVFTPTPMISLINNALWQCAYNPTTSAWEKQLTTDPVSNTVCNDSMQRYGKRPPQTIQLLDVQDDTTATAMVNRQLMFRAYRREVAALSVPIWVGYEILEGDVVALTALDGSSLDGLGWIDEPCIVLDKKYSGANVGLRLMRIQPL